MNKTATAINNAINTCPEDCMCDECLELSNRPTLVPSTSGFSSAWMHYDRILQEHPNVEDQIDPLWNLLTDSSVVITKELEDQIARDIVSIEGILRQAETQRSSQLRQSAVEEVLQRMPTMSAGLTITNLDSARPMGIFEGYGECDDAIDTDDEGDSVSNDSTEAHVAHSILKSGSKTTLGDLMRKKHAQKKKPAKSVPTQRASKEQLLRHRDADFDTPESKDNWDFDDDTYETSYYEMEFGEGHRIQEQLLQQPLIEKQIRHSLVSARRNKQAIYEIHRSNTERGPKHVSKPRKMERRRERQLFAERAA